MKQIRKELMKMNEAYDIKPLPQLEPQEEEND